MISTTDRGAFPGRGLPHATRSLLRPRLLLLLRERGDHGYDLVNRLAAIDGGGSEPATVYRELRGLERDRLVRSAWRASSAGPARRVYELTTAGETALEGCARDVAEAREALGRYLDRYALACRRSDPEPAAVAPARSHDTPISRTPAAAHP